MYEDEGYDGDFWNEYMEFLHQETMEKDEEDEDVNAELLLISTG